MLEGSSEVQTKSYLTPKGLASAYPSLPEGVVRMWLAERSTNGLAPAVRKIGRRVIIDYKMFEDWLDSHAEASEEIKRSRKHR